MTEDTIVTLDTQVKQNLRIKPRGASVKLREVWGTRESRGVQSTGHLRKTALPAARGLFVLRCFSYN
jgi:hypothetical protein